MKDKNSKKYFVKKKLSSNNYVSVKNVDYDTAFREVIFSDKSFYVLLETMAKDTFKEMKKLGVIKDGYSFANAYQSMRVLKTARNKYTIYNGPRIVLNICCKPGLIREFMGEKYDVSYFVDFDHKCNIGVKCVEFESNGDYIINDCTLSQKENIKLQEFIKDRFCKRYNYLISNTDYGKGLILAN